MAEKKQYQQMFTEVGEAKYCHLKSPEKYEGEPTDKCSIQVAFSEAYTDKLAGIIKQVYAEAQASEEFKGKKWRSDPRLSIREDADGNVVGFKFVTKYEVKDKDSGALVKRVIPIVDAGGKVRIDNVSLGNGSKVRIKFSLVPYWKSKDNNGVGLWFDAIQVVELVEFIASSGGFGFDSEDGYKAPCPPGDAFPEDEIPF